MRGRRMRVLFLTGLFTILGALTGWQRGWAQCAQTQTPPTGFDLVPFRGNLQIGAVPSGTAFDLIVDVYTSNASSAAPVWEEQFTGTRAVVPSPNGDFAVTLGNFGCQYSTTSWQDLGAVIRQSSGSYLYIGMQVRTPSGGTGSFVALNGRQQLLASPFAASIPNDSVGLSQLSTSACADGQLLVKQSGVWTCSASLPDLYASTLGAGLVTANAFLAGTIDGSSLQISSGIPATGTISKVIQIKTFSAANPYGALVASIDNAGNVTASSFNGLNFFLKTNDNGGASCDDYCTNTGLNWGTPGTCVSAKRTDTGQFVSCKYAPGATSNPDLMHCYCSSF